MKSRLDLKDLLRAHDKDSLLIAKWIGLPLGWILVLTSIVVYLTHGIQDNTAPSPVFFISVFVIAVFLLALYQIVVMRELRNRLEEPSRFWRSLRRLLGFVLVGFVFFCGFLLASAFGLSRLTSLDDEQVLVAAAQISVAFLLAAFVVLAMRWVLAVQRANRTAGKR